MTGAREGALRVVVVRALTVRAACNRRSRGLL
jgi:hypothetical protein